MIGYAHHLLLALSEGRLHAELPRKQFFLDRNGGGDFRVMPCVLRNERMVLKTVKIVGTDRAQTVVQGKITVGKAFALHAIENFVTHAFDACLLSSARTGLCAALAVERLAPRRGRIGIIGAGRVGWYAGLYIAHLGGFNEIVLFDIDRGRAETCAALLARQCPDIVVRAAHAQPVGLDVVVLATTSQTPFFERRGGVPPLVVSIGADGPEQRELSDAWATDSVLFVDTPDSLDYGDLLAWRREGRVGTERITPILDLYPNPPAFDSTARVFVSTGSALFDAVAIGYLLNVAPD